MANTHMHRAIAELRKAYLFMKANNVSETRESREKDYDAIVALALKDPAAARAEFARAHRRDAWMTVFNQLEFHKWLDKKQREEFLRDVQKNSTIPFTADNIKGTLRNVIEQKDRLFQQSVANVFDDLTDFFYGNTGHSEGWKTNDSYKVNLKLIFPYGCSFSYGSFSLWSGYSQRMDVYADLDRVVAVLDGRTIEDVYTIGAALTDEFHRLGHGPVGPFPQIESTYFRIRYFKKGTVHLVWKRKDLWEKFNRTASQGKRWLGEDTRREANPQAVYTIGEPWIRVADGSAWTIRKAPKYHDNMELSRINETVSKSWQKEECNCEP